MKKTYITPDTKTVKLQIRQHLLLSSIDVSESSAAADDDDSNYYDDF
jgi:hypothetical protein